VKTRVTLEIAVDCQADAMAAARAGADRLELCSDLAGHGYTPDVSLVRQISESPGITAVAMVRPVSSSADARAFLYSHVDWATMRREANQLLAAGAGGIVFGCLTHLLQVDRDQVRELVEIAGDCETVFHRAIDLTPDPFESARLLAELGVRRILTAGLSSTRTGEELGLCGVCPQAGGGHSWHEGGDEWPRRLERISSLVRELGDAIQILPGGGIRRDNVGELITRTGCQQVHSSCRTAGTFDEAQAAGLRASIDQAR
jgi:copper homeostasis protein